MTAENLIFILYKYFDVNNNIDLAEKMGITKQTITNWKTRNSISAIKKKCHEIGIYDDIFGNINNFQNSTNVVGQDFSNNSNAQHTNNINKNINIDENILKLVDTLYSFAKVNNKTTELKKDLSSLLEKYM